jgi:hypothetical protein
MMPSLPNINRQLQKKEKKEKKTEKYGSYLVCGENLILAKCRYMQRCARASADHDRS